jgi:hypothetical protein
MIAEFGTHRYPAVPEGATTKRAPLDESVKQADHAMDTT